MIYLEVESVDRAEMSPKRKFAFVGLCPRLSTFPWLGLDSPRVATSFGSYGLKRKKAQNQEEEDLKTHESERKLCIWVKLPRGSGGGGGSSSSTESTWEAFLGKLEVVTRWKK